MTLRDRFRRWLRLEIEDELQPDPVIIDLIGGLRRDLDATAKVVGGLSNALRQTVNQLNNTTILANNIEGRLAHYELTVPALARAKRESEMIVKGAERALRIVDVNGNERTGSGEAG
jgi:hypothetical protein